MIVPLAHNIPQENITYNYLEMDNVSAFNRFINKEGLQLNYSNAHTWENYKISADLKIQKGTDWYGKPAPTKLEDLERHSRFLGMHLLKEIQPKLEKKMQPYLQYLSNNVMPLPKVAYNDKHLGMFSFDRAALALYQHPPTKGATPLEQTTSQLKIELDKLDIASRVKRVFAYFKNKETSLPSIRIYLMAGANANVQGNEMLYVGLACAELVTFLEIRGVAVEVNVLIGTSFDEIVNVAIVRVKRFQDALDKNQLLLMSSDSRYFRYRGFKALICLSNHFGLTIPSGLGRLEHKMGQNFVNALGTNGFVFEQSYSLENAAKEVTRIIEEYSQVANRQQPQVTRSEKG